MFFNKDIDGFDNTQAVSIVRSAVVSSEADPVDLPVEFQNGIDVRSVSVGRLAIKTVGVWAAEVFGGVLCSTNRAWDNIGSISGNGPEIFNLQVTGIDYLYVLMTTVPASTDVYFIS